MMPTSSTDFGTTQTIITNDPIQTVTVSTWTFAEIAPPTSDYSQRCEQLWAAAVDAIQQFNEALAEHGPILAALQSTAQNALAAYRQCEGMTV